MELKFENALNWLVLLGYIKKGLEIRGNRFCADIAGTKYTLCGFPSDKTMKENGWALFENEYGYKQLLHFPNDFERFWIE